MFFKTKMSISKVFFFNMLFIATLSSLVIGFLWISHEQDDFAKQSSKLKSKYLDTQKNLIKNTVSNAINYIEYKKALTEKGLKEKIKQRVYEAYDIVENIYQSNSGKISDAEIIRLIKQALRPVRFFDNRNYYFIDDLEGNSILYPPKSDFEGKNLMQIVNKEGIKPFPDIIELVKKKGEGYYIYNWVKYTEGVVPTEKEFPKITYFKLFKPYNWFIAVGEYQDYIEDDIKREILERVSKIKLPKGEYISIHTYDGIKLASGGEVLQTSENEAEAGDYKLWKNNEGQIGVTLDDEGKFKYSEVIERSTGKLRSRMIFSKKLPNQNWILTAGVHIDEINQIIANQKSDLEEGEKNNILKIVLIISSLWIFAFVLARYISFKAKYSFTVFSQFFKKASAETTIINPNALHFSEFSDLAYSANQMNENIHRVKKELLESEEKYRVLFQRESDAIFIYDPDTTNILDANDATSRMYEYDYDELIGMSCLKFSAEVKESSAAIDKIREDGEINVPVRLHQKKDGTKFPVDITGHSIKLNGKDVMFASSKDITDRKKQEDLIQSSLKEKETLLQEIHHRVKNNMTVISSLLALQMNSTDNQIAKDALQDSQNRVQSMSMIHETLYRSDNLADIDLATYLSDLGKVVLQNYTISKTVHFKVKAESVMIDSKLASTVGLIVNELIANCLKYAFTDDREGEILLELKSNKESGVELMVSDNGVGIPEGFDLETADSLGLKLVKMLTENQLDGSIDIESKNGTKFTIKFNIET